MWVRAERIGGSSGAVQCSWSDRASAGVICRIVTSYQVAKEMQERWPGREIMERRCRGMRTASWTWARSAAESGNDWALERARGCRVERERAR